MEAWVTLATNDSYALGCMVLGSSLRRAGTSRQLHCLVSPGVTDGMREQLGSVFDAVSSVDVLDSGDTDNLALIGRPDLGVTFTKLHCWRLTQYSKCVFLDADTLVLQNCDELFERPEFAAAPDIGWPDIFNTGVFVFQPSLDTYRALLQRGLTHGSFDGGDQGLLNDYFSDWRTRDASYRLSFAYNMTSNIVYTYVAAYKKFAKDVKIVHFLGSTKPWHHSYRMGNVELGGECQYLHSHLQHWWHIFVSDVHPRLHPQYRAWETRPPAPEPPREIRQSPPISSPSQASAVPSTSSFPPLQCIPHRFVAPLTSNAPAHVSEPKMTVEAPAREPEPSPPSPAREPEPEPSPPPPPSPSVSPCPSPPPPHDLTLEAELPAGLESRESASSPESWSDLTGEVEVDLDPEVAEAAARVDDAEHRRRWEAGHVDYLGRDSWEQIQKRLDKSLGISH